MPARTPGGTPITQEKGCVLCRIAGASRGESSVVRKPCDSWQCSISQHRSAAGKTHTDEEAGKDHSHYQQSEE